MHCTKLESRYYKCCPTQSTAGLPSETVNDCHFWLGNARVVRGYCCKAVFLCWLILWQKKRENFKQPLHRRIRKKLAKCEGTTEHSQNVSHILPQKTLARRESLVTKPSLLSYHGNTNLPTVTTIIFCQTGVGAAYKYTVMISCENVYFRSQHFFPKRDQNFSRDSIP